MSGYVSALWPGSPQDKGSPASSGRSSRSSSGSSRPASRRSSRSSSPGRSRSRSRRRHQRKYRRYSRSYSRSRSWSRSRRRGERRRASPRRRPGSPRRGRSRSRSRSRRSPRGRRHYGFGRTVYPEQRGRRRARSRTRSRSRTPFRLSEKDRMELLEIAKANAAKALGTTNFELPASLRAVLVTKETSHGAAVSSDGAKSEVSTLGFHEQTPEKATAREV